MKYKHLLFDFDDTIYDTRRNAEVALNELYDFFKLSSIYPDYNEFSTTYWKKNHEVWDLYSKGLISRDQLKLERFLYPLQKKGVNDEKLALQLNDWFVDSTSKKTE